MPAEMITAARTPLSPHSVSAEGTLATGSNENDRLRMKEAVECVAFGRSGEGCSLDFVPCGGPMFQLVFDLHLHLLVEHEGVGRHALH